MTELETRKFKIGCEKCGWEAYYFDTEYEAFDGCPGCDEGELMPVGADGNIETKAPSLTLTNQDDEIVDSVCGFYEKDEAELQGKEALENMKKEYK